MQTTESQDVNSVPKPARPAAAGARFLRLPDVMERTGLKRSTIYAMVAEGAFPAAVRLGVRSVGWIASEVDDWIADRIAKRPVKVLQ